MGISVLWLGHSSFQIKVDGKNIYIDPYKGKYVDSADLILITHSHFDHCDLSKIKKVQKNDTIIIAPKACITETGVTIKTLQPGEKFVFEDITVQAVEAYNVKRFRSPGEPFHPKGLGVGYLITIKDKTIYHAGDTDFIPEMKKLKNKVNVALLPSGDTYTMDNEEAAEAALAISPEIVVPMHRWNSNSEMFKKKIESKSKIKVVILKPEEQLEIK
ncbi:MAG: MBL fold metallo-hydrolase [Candidatus Bathyarchaeota archaeon]